MKDVKSVIWKGCVKCKFSFILVFQVYVVIRPNLSILIWNYNFSHKESLERIKKSSCCNATTAIITCWIVIKIQELQESCLYADPQWSDVKGLPWEMKQRWKKEWHQGRKNESIFEVWALVFYFLTLMALHMKSLTPNK